MRGPVSVLVTLLAIVSMSQECCPSEMDSDSDGYCTPEDYNDNDPFINPGTDEIACDAQGVDEDCDGVAAIEIYYNDNDGDGFGDPETTQICYSAGGFVLDDSDCNDNDRDVYPGQSAWFSVLSAGGQRQSSRPSWIQFDRVGRRLTSDLS